MFDCFRGHLAYNCENFCSRTESPGNHHMWVRCLLHGFKAHIDILIFWCHSELITFHHEFVLATSPLRLTTSNFIFQLNTCGYSPYLTSSLMRGWICRLQLPLVLANTVILRSESRMTHDHILLSQIRGAPQSRGPGSYQVQTEFQTVFLWFVLRRSQHLCILSNNRTIFEMETIWKEVVIV
jgi:hypothetical protein